MKNFFCFFFSISIFSTSTEAQEDKSNPIILNVTYTFIHTNNLNDRENPIKKDMVLSVGKSSSRYITEEVFNRANAPRPKPVGATRFAAGMPMVVVGPNGGTVDENYFQFPAIKALDIVSVIGNKDYLAQTKLEKIDWKIDNDIKKIGGFNCQKAIGVFGGRTYIAWFTPDLPFQCGPFKLWGLPGLILEAEDSKNEVRFLFKDINKETDATKRVVTLGATPVKISLADYVKAKKAYQKNPDTYMQSQLPAGVPKVIKVNENGDNGSKNFKENPIEIKPQ